MCEFSPRFLVFTVFKQAGDTFDELKKNARNGYFEKLIKEYLLDNNH